MKDYIKTERRIFNIKINDFLLFGNLASALFAVIFWTLYLCYGTSVVIPIIFHGTQILFLISQYFYTRK